MKIIIVGAGEIGRHLAQSLSNEAHDIVIIECNEALAAELGEQIDARILCSDGSSANILIEAGVTECELFLALTSSNNANLVSASVAKKLGAQMVVARVHPGLQREEWIFDYRANFGIDYIFSSERLAAVELSKFIRNPDSIAVEEIARGRIELQQICVSESGDAAGKTLLELNLPSRIRIGLIVRGGEVVPPTADTRLMPGDLLSIFGEPRKLHDAAVQIGKGVMGSAEGVNVVVFGGGEYGFTLAQMLDSWGCNVRVFDRDPEVCEMLSIALANATVINADATKLSELREEQVGEADFFVATTGSDEDNVMTCMQADNLGAKHCLTLIHRADYADVISRAGAKFGIMSAVSPREATRLELMRFVTSDRFHLVKRFEHSEIIEASVGERASAAGKKVSEIEWPAGCVLVAIIHGSHAHVPAADDVINANDNIYAMVTDPKARKKFLKLVTR